MKTMVTLGGASTYASLAAKRHGLSVAIVSKVGGDFPDEYAVWLARNGIDVKWIKRVPESLTTRFLIDYRNKSRTLKLLSRCEDIRCEDVAEARSRAMHFGPVANEIAMDVVDFLKKRCEVSSIDLQGFIRSFDPRGSMTLKKLDRSGFVPADILKCSDDELIAATERKDLIEASWELIKLGFGVILVTRGERGAIVTHIDGCYEIPAHRTKRVTNPTGAGDVFLGSFMAEYLRGKDIPWCASVASSSSSFAVEEGLMEMGKRDEIIDRARSIYDGVKRII